jgi:uncharacterized protein YfbU (UPF0304 family)
MTLTAAERLILTTNILILERLGAPTDGGVGINQGDLRVAREALQYGFELEYGDLPFPLSVFEETFSAGGCEEVRDVLRMFDTLKIAWDRSDPKDGVTEDELRFPGWDYDGAEAQHWEYSKYLIETRGLYGYVVGGDDTRSVVSHHNKYRAMYAVFTALPQHNITIEGIKQVLAAGK